MPKPIPTILNEFIQTGQEPLHLQRYVVNMVRYLHKSRNLSRKKIIAELEYCLTAYPNGKRIRLLDVAYERMLSALRG